MMKKTPSAIYTTESQHVTNVLGVEILAMQETIRTQQAEIDRLTEQHNADDKRIADLLTVIAKKDEAINGLLNAVENGTWCYETSDCGDDGAYIGNAVSLDSDEVKNAENALAITPESVELVEFACTIENGVNNNINDYALYKREDAEMHCRGECANLFRIVPLYTIKHKGRV